MSQATASTSYTMIITGRDLNNMALEVNTKFQEIDEEIKQLREAVLAVSQGTKLTVKWWEPKPGAPVADVALK